VQSLNEELAAINSQLERRWTTRMCALQHRRPAGGGHVAIVSLDAQLRLEWLTAPAATLLNLRYGPRPAVGASWRTV